MAGTEMTVEQLTELVGQLTTTVNNLIAANEANQTKNNQAQENQAQENQAQAPAAILTRKVLNNTKHFPVFTNKTAPYEYIQQQDVITGICKANNCQQILENTDTIRLSLPADGFDEQNPTADQVIALQQHENCLLILNIVFNKKEELKAYVTQSKVKGKFPQGQTWKIMY